MSIFTLKSLTKKNRIEMNENEPKQLNSQRSTKLVWLQRLFRWGIGGLFITVGIIYFKDGGWPAVIFGTVILITGFLRPRRCLNEE
jgi:hypothetical protein